MQYTAAAQLIGAEGHERLALSTRRLFVLVIVAGCLLLALIAAQQLRAARQGLLQGAHQLEAARLKLDLAGTVAAPHRLIALRQQVASAEESFHAARQDLGPWTGILDRLGWLPRVGPQLAAAGPAADTGYHLTRGALAILDGLHPVVDVLGRRLHGDRVALLAGALARSEARFRGAAAEADAASAAAAHIPSSLHSAHWDVLLARLRRQLPLLQGGAHLLAASPRLLGVGHPAHYLFAWENPAELRATGGFIGAVDYLTVRGGSISHTFYGHILPHEITTAELPLPEAVYTPEDYWLFCDSNWSPSFPLTARLERWFYGEDTGHWADGVVDFVDTGISPILRATGPVYLPGYRRWVTATNVQALATEYINGSYKGPSTTGLPETVRKQFFRAVMTALLDRFQHLPLSSLPRLASTVQTLINGRDLLFYHRDPAIEAQIERARAAGVLRPHPGDFLMVVDDNRSYNKLNPYVIETGSYLAEVAPSGEIAATLTLHYTVRPSPATLEGFGPDWGRWGTKHDYQDFLRVFVPAGARLRSLAGADVWVPQPAYGLTQFAARFLVTEGRTATVTLRYTIPPGALGSLPRPAYQLSVQRQPGANLGALAVTVSGRAGLLVGGAAGPVHSDLSLSRDAAMTVPVTGARFRETTIPAGATPDPYIPYAALLDPHHPL